MSITILLQLTLLFSQVAVDFNALFEALFAGLIFLFRLSSELFPKDSDPSRSQTDMILAQFPDTSVQITPESGLPHAIEEHAL